MCQCWTLIKACFKKNVFFDPSWQDSTTQLLHPWSESPVPLPPKGALLVWYPVTVEAVWVQWTVMFKNWVWYDFNFVAWRVIVLEMAIRRRVQCRHTAMNIVSNSPHMWMWCLNDDQLLLRGTKRANKILSLHHHVWPEPLIKGMWDLCFDMNYDPTIRFVALETKTHLTREHFSDLLYSSQPAEAPDEVFCCSHLLQG